MTLAEELRSKETLQVHHLHHLRYVPSLIGRKKWRTKERNFQPGDRVLVADPNLPRGQFKIGRVTKAIAGADGLVRVVEVRVYNGRGRSRLVAVCTRKVGFAKSPETSSEDLIVRGRRRAGRQATSSATYRDHFFNSGQLPRIDQMRLRLHSTRRPSHTVTTTVPGTIAHPRKKTKCYLSNLSGRPEKSPWTVSRLE